MVQEIKEKQKDDAEEEEEERLSWGKSIEFFLSLLGWSVGLGNILRFPYLTLRNGGGAFLFPYFICLFVCGMPLFLLEVYMGQRSRTSCIACWDKFSPIMKGVGYCMLTLSFVSLVTYQAVMAWILYYLASSLTWNLPWTSCNSTWNTDNCVLTLGGNSSDYENGDYNLANSSLGNDSSYTVQGHPMSATEEYWQNHILRLSDGIEEIGLPSWQLCVAHCVGWVVVFFCLIRSVKSVGKVVWITALAPYLLILCFLVRAVMLPGSLEGIKFYITPDFQALRNPEVWMLAFLQNFYSLGPGWGSLSTMASFNKPNHNFLFEAFLVPICCCLTSFVGGFVVFSCAGYLSYKSGVSVQEAVSSGPGLAFVTYPEVTSHLPGGPIWAVMFFLMLFLVALDTQFVNIETVVSSIRDHLHLGKKHQLTVLCAVVFVNMSLGLLFFTRAGMYYFQLIDWYFTVIGIFLTTASECLTCMWLYGYKRVIADIQAMTGRTPPRYLLIPLWSVIIPCFIVTAMAWSVGTLTKPNYGRYQYPEWCAIFGWAIAIACALPPFAYAIYKILATVRGPNKCGQIRELFRPVRHKDPQQVPMNDIPA